MSWRSAVIALACVASGAACTKTAPPAGEAPPREVPKLSRLSTTAAAIALGNLDAQIQGRERMLSRDAGDVGAARALVELLLARGEYASRIADYERADAVAQTLVEAHPESSAAHLVRAATLGTFHSFGPQLAELDAAEQAKASPDAVRAARATVYMAEGRFDDAAALGAWKDPDSLEPMGLVAAAVLAGERDERAESERLFERARATYRDVSPFPVAWMDFQRGALLERQGDRSRAKLYFAEAHEALPGFAHPVVHLAGLETPAEALALLEPLVGKTDDPQVDAAYADALRRLDRSEDASAAAARARMRYEELVQKHPLAFADHAAQFYLGLGRDPARALVLARENARNRATEPAIDLLLTAELVAGTRDEVCAAAAAGAALRYATPAFRAVVETTRGDCAPR